jgi:uncharacterized C2H2 Zn-finger protein
MNRDDIINLSGCRICSVQAGSPCLTGEGGERKRCHVERLYSAQDRRNGKRDRTTGKVNWTPFAEQRCPVCRKMLRDSKGAIQHAIDAHGLKRDDVLRLRVKFMAENDRLARKPAEPASDDFDLIDDSDV